MYSVYILQCSDDTFYVGQTENLNRRVHRHKRGIATPYTSKRQPVDLVWFVTGLKHRQTALDIEHELQHVWNQEHLWELTQGYVWAMRLIASMVHYREGYPEPPTVIQVCG